MRVALTLLIAIGVGLVGLTVLGCGGSESATPPPKSAPTAPDTRPVDLKDVTLAKLDELVGKQKGRVVLIDCWATTCVPCRKAFPHTIALHQKYEKDGLAVITVCSDPTDYRDKAAKFLKENNATCTNFFMADPKPSKELDEKYPTDALPAMILFDRAGNRVKAFTFAVDEQEVDELVAKLVAAN
ncbi:MAG TPA: TlpA disulfide reductase family protein [Fimbriiglobus sp.]|jgi:thiol-disulfide isomerase/thioredoxin